MATQPGGLVGEIVRFPTMQSLRDAPMTGLEDKIVFVDEFMTRTQDGSGYGAAVQKPSGAANEAGRRGAAAALIRSVGTHHHRFPHTGQMRYQDSVHKVPIAALSPPDADQLRHALSRGKVDVKLILDVTSSGERQSGNVIGEIPGSTDEVMLIGGHLDSWDLGTGAVDDGAGIGITVGAAKMIMAMGKTPKRTIRVVMFGADSIYLAWIGVEEYLSAEKVPMSRVSFQRALEELLETKFLAESTKPSMYWFNPNLFFNGDRMTFIHEYKIKNNKSVLDHPDQATLQDEGDTHLQQDLIE